MIRRGLGAAVLLIAGFTPIVLGLAIFFLGAPCPTEDSLGCTWYGQSQGNGIGATYTAVTDDLVIYWDR